MYANVERLIDWECSNMTTLVLSVSKRDDGESGYCAVLRVGGMKSILKDTFDQVYEYGDIKCLAYGDYIEEALDFLADRCEQICLKLGI